MTAALLLLAPWSVALAASESPPDADRPISEASPEAAALDEAAEEASDEGPTEVEKGFLSTTLDSGLTVSIYSNPTLPVVATQTWVHVGSAHEADNELGFAHLFEHLMFGATENHDAEAYAHHHTVHGGRMPTPSLTRRSTSRPSRPRAMTGCSSSKPTASLTWC